MQSIYLDNNATTTIDPRVADAIHRCHLAGFVNPASQHQLGQRARTAIENSREAIAALVGARTGSVHADRVLFTSGGTEANNLALLGMAGQPPGRIVISAIEHPSVQGAADELRRRGFNVRLLPVTSAGVVDLERVEPLLGDDTRLVSVQLANHETGVLQPIRELASLCNARQVPLHTDATQAVGKVPVDFQSLDVAAMTITPHKFHGPVGIGALIVRHSIQPTPILFGGFQQLGFRPGTENVALAVGMEVALRCCLENLAERREQMAALRDLFETSLLRALPAAIVNGGEALRLPNTSNIAFPGCDRQSLLMALDMAGIACSTGSACASGSSEPSPVLTAMGLAADRVHSSLRFSVSVRTTREEIVAATQRIPPIVHRLRRSS